MSEEPTTCHQCGAPAEAEVKGEGWCAECLHIAGSCCAGDEG